MFAYKREFLAPEFIQNVKAGSIEFDVNTLGEWVALLAEPRLTINIEKIRRELEANPELYETLSQEAERAGVDLSPLFALDASDVRTDLPNDYAEWEEILQDAARSSNANAEALFRLWIDEASARGVELSDEDQTDAPHRIRDSLSAITAALEEVMPWEARRVGRALLEIALGRSNAPAVCRWINDKKDQEREIDLYELARHRFDMVGKFGREALDLLTDCLPHALAGRAISLPGFALEEQVSADRFVFAWTPPVLEGDIEDVKMRGS